MSGKRYVLFNPKAGNGDCYARARALEENANARDAVYLDITQIRDYAALMQNISPEDTLLLCGGDGTLNRFVNDTCALHLPNRILYYGVGTGNDFLRDLGKKDGCPPFRINEYLNALPTVTVNGTTRYFLNGVGFGLDGYCCEVGDRLREKRKTPNYTAIAVRGLLYDHKPTTATVTVDGAEHRYERTWIAATMHGRFYGGGMMPAPSQRRSGFADTDGTVSLVAIHGAGRLRTLCATPSLFTGTHLKYKSMVEVIRGNRVTVTFDRPTALQIDGETILNVRSYTVNTSAARKELLL